MKIETKYNVDDIVYMVTNRILTAKVDCIEICIDADSRRSYIRYSARNCFSRMDENRLYPTKEAAAEAWLASQNLSVGVHS